MEAILNQILLLDLMPLHIILGLTAFFLCIFVMALEGHVHEGDNDPIWNQWAVRSSYAILAFGILASIGIQLRMNWQPWPSELLLMFGLILKFFFRILAIYSRIARETRAIKHVAQKSRLR